VHPHDGHDVWWRRTAVTEETSPLRSLNVHGEDGCREAHLLASDHRRGGPHQFAARTDSRGERAMSYRKRIVIFS
jgi:hypothetical protein